MIVKIDGADSIAVERAFFEYNAGMANAKYLARDKNVDRDILQEYFDINETRYIELDMLKDKMAKKYEPKEMLGKKYDYMFNFEDETIEYTEHVS